MIVEMHHDGTQTNRNFKSKNTSLFMLHKVFKRETIIEFVLIFLFSCIILVIIIFLLSLLSAGYEERTNISPISCRCYALLDILHFSLSTWYVILPSDRFGFASYIASIATTGFIISLFVFLVIHLYELFRRIGKQSD